MPRHFTHYLFSQKLTDALPYASSSIVKLYPDAYLLGSLGADLFRSEHRERLDAADPLQIFGVTARHIYMNGSKCQLSYMLGYITHYALDRIANPFVDFFAANGVHQYFGGKVETVSREGIEIGIDRHVIRDYLGMDAALAICGALKTRNIVLDEISELYTDVLNDLSDICLSTRKTRALLENVSPDIPLAEGMGRLDYMNRENHDWTDVAKKKFTLSMDEILEEERETACYLLDEYMAMARSNKEADAKAFSLNGRGERVQQ